MFKTCSRCKIAKEESDFYRGGGKLLAHCKQCDHEKSKLWRQKNPERVKENSKKWKSKNPSRTKELNRISLLRRRYDMTPEQLRWAEEQAAGVCPLCGDKAKLVIDHDHNTGKFRGLLCLKCNGGLGLFRDNIEALKTAIEYLKNGGTKMTTCNKNHIAIQFQGSVCPLCNPEGIQ